MMADTLANNNWISDLDFRNGLTINHFNEYTRLCALVCTVDENERQEHRITWRLTSDGKYTAKLAYKVQIVGCTKASHLHVIWQTWAPPKC